MFIFFLISRVPLELKKKDGGVTNKGGYLMYLLKATLTILQGDDIFAICFYLLISAAGALSNTYYFSIHLFFIFSRLSLLRNVF
jgi:inositol 1,4,5-triphosphate receptor type 1/inositol 1,4,5-triphosphate receptor type 3